MVPEEFQDTTYKPSDARFDRRLVKLAYSTTCLGTPPPVDGAADEEEATKYGIIRVRTAQNAEPAAISRAGSGSSPSASPPPAQGNQWWNGIGDALHGIGAEVQRNLGLSPKVTPRNMYPEP